MARLHGITVKLYTRIETGRDALNNPVLETVETDVQGVLVGSPSTSDITNSIQMDGKRIDYLIGIPKGDTNAWTDSLVEIDGGFYETFGEPMTGIQDLIPMGWGKTVKCCRFNGDPNDWVGIIGTKDGTPITTESGEVIRVR